MGPEVQTMKQALAFAILVALILLLAHPAGAVGDDVAVLVLHGGQRLTVASYEVDGPAVLIVALDGEAHTLRADLVDLAASEAATTAERERRQRAAEAEAEAEAAEEAASLEREAQDAATRAATSNKGSVATVGEKAASTGSTSTGDDFAVRLEVLRRQHEEYQTDELVLERQHNAAVERHNATSSAAERAILQQEIATLRGKLTEAVAAQSRIRGEHNRLREEARKAGAPQSVYLRPLGGRVR